MAHFNTLSTRKFERQVNPVVSEKSSSLRTHEGGDGFARDARSELYLMAVSAFVGEDNFYESAGKQDSRYVQLIHKVAREDPDWTTKFLKWLRHDANVRTAAIVGAAEYVKALLGRPDTANSRSVVDSVIVRADEPGEMLAYWTSRYGRAIPKAVKRGVADAARRLYTERNLLKYDTASRGFRFADVLELTHPKPKDEAQAVLFTHAIDRRHSRAESLNKDALPMLVANAKLRFKATKKPEKLLDAGKLKAAGMTWEDALSLVGGTVNKAKLWEALIPSMGYMALLRNLNNFDVSGVSNKAAESVAARLADSTEVARSRQLPMRFLSAYNAVPSSRWAWPLEQALEHCLSNIPQLAGETLIMIDTSCSMDVAFSRNGSLRRWDAAVVFGLALARRCTSADIVSYSNATRQFEFKPGESLLKAVQRWKSEGYFYGGGTATASAVKRHLNNHERVIILTDEQDSLSYAAVWGGRETSVSEVVPKDTQLITFNLAGYKAGHAPSGTRNRVTVGGLSDQAFKMIPLLDTKKTDWPWEG